MFKLKTKSFLPIAVCWAYIAGNLLWFAFKGNVVIFSIVATVSFLLSLILADIKKSIVLFCVCVSSFVYIGMYATEIKKTEENIIYGQDAEFSVQIMFTEKEKTKSNIYRAKLKDQKIYTQIEVAEKIKSGECIKVIGSLKNIDDSQYGIFLKSQRVFAEIDVIKYSIEENCSKSMVQKMADIKCTVSDHIARNIPEPQAAFMSGILFGERKGFDQETTENLKITGTTHIIAISGYNIALISTICLSVLSVVVSRKKIVIPVIMAIVAFTIFVGFSASVVRAAIMGIIVIIAQHFGKEGISKRALLYCVLIMTMINPYIIVTDVSFQLSVAATWGILFLNPVFEKYLGKIIYSETIIEELSITLSAGVSTAPISMYVFSGYSLISPITNLVIATLLPSSYALGSISVIISFFVERLSFLLLPAQALLKMLLVIIDFSAKIPNSYIEISEHKLIAISACILVIVIIVVISQKNENH